MFSRMCTRPWVRARILACDTQPDCNGSVSGTESMLVAECRQRAVKSLQRETSEMLEFVPMPN